VTRPPAPARRTAAAVATAAALTLWSQAPLVAGPPAPGPSCTWRVHPLPSLPGADENSGNGISGSDGLNTFAGNSAGHAALWRNGRVIDLGPGQARDINRRGEAVGERPAPGRPRPTLWRDGRTMALAEPAGTTYTRPVAINIAGTVTGFATFPGTEGGPDPVHPVVWNSLSPNLVRDLGPFHGEADNVTELTDVTEDGLLVGIASDRRTLRSRAIVGATRTGLQILPLPANTVSTSARGAAGSFVAGQRIPAHGGPAQPVLWENGSPRVLTVTVGVTAGVTALAVNRSGTAVGDSLAGGLVWFHGGDPCPLPTTVSGGSATANTVTDSGVLGGVASDSRGVGTPALWTRG
jgi:uncharacterized membrane protein